MIIKQLIDEDFINYKKASMVIGFPYCSFKCDKECGQPVCQNSTLANAPEIRINSADIVDRYINNPITSAIVYQGLEPLDSWTDLISLTRTFRQHTNDDIVIYTGYNKDEIKHSIEQLKEYKNIIIKYGRYVPNQKKHYDEILGIELASDNQFAEKIS